MAIKMVRQPSDTPNIKNVDDIIPFRYAYGNQNGYVLGKGSELSYTINGSSFIINSGRIVLQGVESDIDANGITLTFDNVSQTRYYTIYYQVNLGTNSVFIDKTYDTAGYIPVEIGDDLTVNSSGISQLELYRLTVTSGVISSVQKIVKHIEYINPDSEVKKAKKAEDSDAVNGVKIKVDENGVLNIDGIIIPQNKVIWSGNSQLNYRISLFEGVGIGDKLCVKGTYFSDAFESYIIVNGTSYQSGQNSNSSSLNCCSFYYRTATLSFALYANVWSETEISFGAIDMEDLGIFNSNEDNIYINKIYKVIE